MLEVIQGILLESVYLLNKMSPYLLFGFLFAGILHVYVSLDFVANHLGKSNIGSIIKSVLFGIPLPLCSCSVIPAAITLRKKGANKGATVSFLVATPITGVDSIFATYSLLGFFFTVFRVIASSITALVAGFLTLLFTRKDSCAHGIIEEEECIQCQQEEKNDHKHFEGFQRVKELFHYAFVELLGDIWKWLAVGMLIAGVISYSIPDTFIKTYIGSTWLSMIIMLLIGIPMYVCSTGSIPIAASLLLKGISPGAALVFLLAGPATNAVTVTVVSKEIGKVGTVIYVLSIAVMSVLLGMLLNTLWSYFNLNISSILAPMDILPAWIGVSSSITLIFLIIISILNTKIHG